MPDSLTNPGSADMRLTEAGSAQLRIRLGTQALHALDDMLSCGIPLNQLMNQLILSAHSEARKIDHDTESQSRH